MSDRVSTTTTGAAIASAAIARSTGRRFHMQPRALVFDVFGTVVDWRTSIIAEFQRFGREKGITLDWEAFVDHWKGAYHPGMDAVREGRRPWATVDRLYREKLDELLGEYGITQLTEAEKTHLNTAWHRLEPWPDAVGGLARLRTRYIISTLSNGDLACLVDMAKHGGLPWDCILCAQIFRHYKPDPEVYLGAIELLGCKPHEVMLVAAHNYDLAAARSHGMATAFVARPTEYGPAQTSDLTADEDWDVIADDFGALAEALQT
jgi:2-haloacid dehalogenase